MMDILKIHNELISLVKEVGHFHILVRNVATTMIYTHVLKVGGAGVRSPLDALPPLTSVVLRS